LFPNHVNNWLGVCETVLIGRLGPIVIGVALGAVAYAMGFIAEFVARVMFEWRLDRVKRKRFSAFLEDNPKLLDKDTWLRGLVGKPSKLGQEAGTRVIGLMRFSIILRSPELSREVDSHVKRMRVLRMLALAQFLFLPAVARNFWDVPFLLALLLIALALLAATCCAVEDRFQRYCREIERSYLVLSANLPQSQRGGSTSLVSE